MNTTQCRARPWDASQQGAGYVQLFDVLSGPARRVLDFGCRESPLWTQLFLGQSGICLLLVLIYSKCRVRNSSSNPPTTRNDRCKSKEGWSFVLALLFDIRSTQLYSSWATAGPRLGHGWDGVSATVWTSQVSRPPQIAPADDGLERPETESCKDLRYKTAIGLFQRSHVSVAKPCPAPEVKAVRHRFEEDDTHDLC